MDIFLDEFKHLKIQLEEIKSATDDFGDNNLIGRGGFGKVYKGTIAHSKGKSIVAFKRLDSALGQGNSEFWKEIMMLSRYRHENLVSLLRYCDKGDEKILVYEYASRGSLDRHLSDASLTWMQRLRICLGAARGLSYLHDPKGTQQRVLHRDIKSSNILLDENWNAKVSDLGLSRISPANQPHTILVSNMVGTVGYLDPLYLEMGLLTKESDVYSFGVVLFEVLCGRLCYEYIDSRVQTLVRFWKKSYKENKLNEIIFQDMLHQMDLRSLKTFSDIAYQCLHKSLEERPMMARVVKQLEIALEHQVTCEQGLHYEEMNRNRTEVPPPLNYIPKEEPEMLLSEGNLLYAEKGRSIIRRFRNWYVNDPSSTEGFPRVFKAREWNIAGDKKNPSELDPSSTKGFPRVFKAREWNIAGDKTNPSELNPSSTEGFPRVFKAREWNIAGDKTNPSELDPSSTEGFPRVFKAREWNIAGDKTNPSELDPSSTEGFPRVIKAREWNIAGDKTNPSELDPSSTEGFPSVFKAREWNIAGDKTNPSELDPSSTKGFPRVFKAREWNIAGDKTNPSELDPSSTKGFPRVFKAREWNIAGDKTNPSELDPSSTEGFPRVFKAREWNIADPHPATPKGFFRKVFNKASDKMKEVASRSSQ